MQRDDIGFGREPYAPYAVDGRLSRGRLVPEPDSPTRTPYQRDRDRIIHSTSFRRLKHKTQVFVFHEGDHYRTRLTHSIEVSQIARAIARALRVDEDLAEALALAHDLGHTPYGHTGEDALDAVMADYGGFDHNAQTLRIVTKLEHRYAAFDGLNLSWETLEGLVKHNGPLVDGNGVPLGRYAKKGLPAAFLEYEGIHSLDLWSYASLEAQAAALADDIAYDAHDIDDGLRAGLFSVDDMAGLPLVGGFIREIHGKWPGLELSRAVNEITRRIITRMVEDAIDSAQRALKALRPESVDDVRRAGRTIVAFSPELVEADRAIKGFLFPHMYRHPDVMRVRHDADRLVKDLFHVYMDDPSRLPDDWALPPGTDEARVARRIADYIAGMTDGFALADHRRWFDDTPDLR